MFGSADIRLAQAERCLTSLIFDSLQRLVFGCVGLLLTLLNVLGVLECFFSDCFVYIDVMVCLYNVFLL